MKVICATNRNVKQKHESRKKIQGHNGGDCDQQQLLQYPLWDYFILTHRLLQVILLQDQSIALASVERGRDTGTFRLIDSSTCCRPLSIVD